ncbi:CapA family protein [Spirochaetota bacterium]
MNKKEHFFYKMFKYRKINISIILIFSLALSLAIISACSKQVKEEKTVKHNENINRSTIIENLKNIRETHDKNISILCMGDLLIGHNVEKIIECSNPRYPFMKLEDEFKKYDIVFANLETSITKRGDAHESKPYTFRIKYKNAIYLRSLKIDVVSVANNHLLDFGVKGMYDTLMYIRDWGIKYSGAGIDLKNARKPSILRRKGVNVIFLSYCERPPMDFYATDKKPGTAPLNLKYIEEDIKKYKKKDNIVLISLHWGIQSAKYPRKDQVKKAHKIIDAGADGIIGHHTHVPQGIEIYKGKPIIYSLGNLISGFYSPRHKDNIMVVLRYWKNQIINFEVIPITGQNFDMHFQPYILKGKRAVKSLNRIIEISNKFKTKMVINKGRLVASVPLWDGKEIKKDVAITKDKKFKIESEFKTMVKTDINSEIRSKIKSKITSP